MLQLLGVQLFHTITFLRPSSLRKFKTSTNSCRNNNFKTATSTRNHLPKEVRENHNIHHNHDTGHASLVRRISSFWNLHQIYKGSALAKANWPNVSSLASRLSFQHPPKSKHPIPSKFSKSSSPVSLSTKAPSNKREAPKGCLILPTELLIEVLKECMWQMERENYPGVGFASHNPPLVLRSVCRLWNECFEKHTSLQLFVKATFSNKECTQVFPRRSRSDSANPIKEILKTDAETYRLCDLALAFDDWSCYVSNDTFNDILELVPRSTSLQITLPNGQPPLFPPDPVTTTGDTLLDNILARLEANSNLQSLYLKWDQNVAHPFVLNGTISVQHHTGFLWTQLQHLNLNCRLSLGTCHSIMNTCSGQLVTASLGLVNRGDPALAANEITLPKLRCFALQTSGSISEADLVPFFGGLKMPGLKEIDFQIGWSNLAVADFPLAWDRITKMVLRCGISQENLWNLFKKITNVVAFELHGNQSYSFFDEKTPVSLPHLTTLTISAEQTMFASQPFKHIVNSLLNNHNLYSIQVPCIPDFPNVKTGLRTIDLKLPISLGRCVQVLRHPWFQGHIQHATFALTPSMPDAALGDATITLRNLKTLTLYSDADCHQLVERIKESPALKISIMPRTYKIEPHISGM